MAHSAVFDDTVAYQGTCMNEQCKRIALLLMWVLLSVLFIGGPNKPSLSYFRNSAVKKDTFPLIPRNLFYQDATRLQCLMNLR